MESIGSVAAMYDHTTSSSSTAESAFANFQMESDPLAEQILACNGMEAYEQYCRDSKAIRARQYEQEQQEVLNKLALKVDLRAAAFRFLSVEARIEKALVNVVSKIVNKAADRRVHLLRS